MPASSVPGKVRKLIIGGSEEQYALKNCWLQKQQPKARRPESELEFSNKMGLLGS